MSTYLKKEFESAGYKVETPVDGLLVVKNFVTQDEIDTYFEMINKSTQEDWEGHYTRGLKTFCLEKFGRDDVENLVAEGKFEITDNWHDKNLYFGEHSINHQVTSRLQDIIDKGPEDLQCSGFYFFQRMYEGVELIAHTDQHTDPSIKYAAIIYIHDDYNKGEVFWPNKNLELKPETGSLLIFPGNDEFNHGVRHVGSGPIRYVLPAFLKVKFFYEKNRF